MQGKLAMNNDYQQQELEEYAQWLEATYPPIYWDENLERDFIEVMNDERTDRDSGHTESA